MNGEVSDLIFPSKGLHQEDPFNPYLFLIYIEGLSSLLRLATTNGELRGVWINTHAHLITHLFFANDCLIFEDATVVEASALKKWLKIYTR